MIVSLCYGVDVPFDQTAGNDEAVLIRVWTDQGQS